MSTSLPLPGSLRPRHPDGDHPVLRALDPRNVADQEGLVAPGVQVPPLAAARIVARARLAAVRTSQRAPSGPLQLQPKLLRLPGRLHPGDLPLRTEAQNGIQPVPSSHVCEFLSVSFAGQAPRASAPRGSTTQSPPSPASRKAARSSSPISSSTRGLGAQPSRCAWSGREDASPRRRHARFLRASPPHSPSHRLACEGLPARPMIQLRMLPPTTTSEEPYRRSARRARR